MTSARSRTGVSKEATDILLDIQDVTNEYGTPVTLHIRGESEVTRDKYNSIKQAQSSPAALINTYAYPVSFSPTTDELLKAGLHHKVDVMIYIAMQDIIDAGYTYWDIDETRSTVTMEGNTFNLKEKNKTTDYGLESGHVTLGLFRK